MERWIYEAIALGVVFLIGHAIARVGHATMNAGNAAMRRAVDLYREHNARLRADVGR